jgi:cobalt transporter subunit CbtA
MAGHASACGPIECSGNRGWKVRARLAWRALGHVLSFTVRDRGCRCSAKRPVRGNVNWRQGLIWGLGGFVAFNLASALGLPPDLPGTEVASLEARQIWWLATVVLTSVGLAMLVFGPKVTWKAGGLVPMVLPHVLGAPRPEVAGGLAPAEPEHQFVIASLATNAAVWLVLGG